MSVSAIFAISDEHETLAAFALGDGEGLDVLAMAYRKPDGELEAKFRQRYRSGRKDVWEINVSPDDSEEDVVGELSSIFDALRSDFPNSRGRFVGPSEAARLSTVELLTFAMQGCQ